MNNCFDSKLLPTYEELLKQGYTDKFNTLSLRFIEGPKDDSLKLPLDLRCGTLSFSQDPRTRDVYDSSNEFRFISFDLSTERLVSLNQNLTNLKLQMHDAEKNCIHSNSTISVALKKIPNRRSDDIISQVNNTMSVFESQVFQFHHILTQEEKLLNTSIKKLQHWVASQVIQSTEYQRRLNRCNVLSHFNSTFHLASLYIRNREPRLFHNILRCGETIKLKKPSVWPPKNFTKYFPETAKWPYKPWNFQQALQIAVNAIPHKCPSSSLSDLCEMEKLTKKLAALQNEFEKSQEDCYDHLKHKYHILVEKIRKSTVVQNHILNQCQHIRDEEISVYNNFPFLTSSYEVCLLNLLGQGAFAEVWKCFDTKTLQMQAIKILNIDIKSSAQDRNFILLSTYQEASLQKNLKHPHVVEMQRCFDVSQTTFVFILDLCNGGTLYNFLQKNGPLKENLAKQWMHQLLLGLHYIHKHANVVHFDIKPSNILLHNNQIKISDFGLHQSMNETGVATLNMEKNVNFIGTLWYMPPEHLYAIFTKTESRFDGRFDVWSAGIVFFEMLYQRRLFSNLLRAFNDGFQERAMSLYIDMVHGGYHFNEYTNIITDDCKKFFNDIFQPMNTRLTAYEALHHSYFSDIQTLQK